MDSQRVCVVQLPLWSKKTGDYVSSIRGGGGSEGGGGLVGVRKTNRHLSYLTHARAKT